MTDSTAFAAPLELTERAKTPMGSMRVVLDVYPSGALSVALVPEANPADGAPLMLSVDMPKAKRLARGEFTLAGNMPPWKDALLRGGLFRATGKDLADHAVWSLDGLAMIEFRSAFRPPLAASRVSFPAHLFENKELSSEAQKQLIHTFEAEGYTRHSAQGASVWVVKKYCERKKLPFTVYRLTERDAVVGVLVCKRIVAAALANIQITQGHEVQMVYESPAYSP